MEKIAFESFQKDECARNNNLTCARMCTNVYESKNDGVRMSTKKEKEQKTHVLFKLISLLYPELHETSTISWVRILCVFETIHRFHHVENGNAFHLAKFSTYMEFLGKETQEL